MKKIIIYITSLILFSGCIIEPITEISQYIDNKTNHNIKITIKNENIDSIIIIDAGEKILIQSGFSLPNLLTGDSIIVVFDDKYRVLHYKSDSLILSNSKIYYFNNQRNIINLNNYKKEDIKISKHSFEQIYTYTFTEQDYIDAQ